MSDSSSSNKQQRFELNGPMGDYDKRTTHIRGDLADIKLAGKLFAPHYVVPQPRSCVIATATMHELPMGDARAVSQLVHGEIFAVLDISGEWAWGFGTHDDYLGYVRLSALGEETEASHVVDARAALIFAKPDIKSALLQRLPMGARLECTAMESEDANPDFLKTGKGYVHARHVSELGSTKESIIDIARKFMGAPYVWGGRSGDGLDCSGLVQMVLGMMGMDAPRDSDQQMAALGSDVPEGEALQAGDIIFFPGHVGIMTSSDNMIHANAHWMQVAEEPLADVIARFPVDVGHPVLARKRLA
ncbi:C40 family peptidase [Sphingorhabdus sp. Alg239-R122]|uniref:C40 family peptidase n=1 Tax=Sphingorhabdus sp. Alg239-R122 TaxID=2305989 RepID=UPI001F07792D|nr:C40 family peptidase [Sphingorhabdus sp. Alg239-R122]